MQSHETYETEAVKCVESARNLGNAGDGRPAAPDIERAHLALRVADTYIRLADLALRHERAQAREI